MCVLFGLRPCEGQERISKEIEDRPQSSECLASAHGVNRLQCGERSESGDSEDYLLLALTPIDALAQRTQLYSLHRPNSVNVS